MLTQLEELWNYAQSVSTDDDHNPEPPEFKEISKEVIQKLLSSLMPNYLVMKMLLQKLKQSFVT